MGGGCSHNPPGYNEAYAISLYETALQNTCLLPDVGIDKSLMKYSGLNSSAELQAYSDELLNSLPGNVEKLGSSLGGMTSIPNAVGLIAMVISMIMEMAITSSQQTSPDTYSLLHRVFGEEKASAVRDTMSLSVTRCHTFMNNNQRLQEELRRLEEQLSGHLTTLRNSLLYDDQMSSRGFKIWVNGASFHVQMLIHEARLNVKARKRVSDYVDSIKATISLYLLDLERLLEKYKTYKISTTELAPDQYCVATGWGYVCRPANCYIRNTEKTKCETLYEQWPDYPCVGCDITEAYINHVFSRYEPITSLRNHFSTTKNNINSLINQHDGFTLPSIF
ncbi:uncharacterized protein LOC122979999 [Thunnus albacares]|uniref:uncharacterized protein LOC122979999 n=1 Tax=Thunnus albacares TaxID=8236 RepID=UPI001CF663D4|nr:uncharacterized protein LOC122979999 [Thunnus albacares]